MFKKNPELQEAAKKCKVKLPFDDFDSSHMYNRLDYIKWFLKEKKPRNVDETVEMLETVKRIKEDLNF